MIHGIDISEHQAGINVAATGTAFCMIKASEGEWFVDPELVNHHRSARVAGVGVGFYHMARPTPENDPVREARHFLQTIAGLLMPGDVLALDWERENSHNTAWAETWLDTVSAAWPNRTIWLYANTFTANAYDWATVQRVFPLWQAHYGTSRSAVPGWVVAAWQHTDTGRLPGYAGNLDLNEIYSTRSDGMPEFTLPTSRSITQSWNMDFKILNGIYYPNGFYASLGWRGHPGIDYGCHVGDPVEAVCDGVVVFAGSALNHPWLSGGGMAVLVLNEELGIYWEYLHLSQIDVHTGQRVQAWQVIARSGNTGTSSAPHLHLGALPLHPNLNNGYRGRIDPTPYLYGGTINPAGGAIYPAKDAFEMATPEDVVKLLLDTHIEEIRPGVKVSLRQVLSEFRSHIISTNENIAKVPEKILNKTVQKGGLPGETTLGALVAWNDSHVIAITNAIGTRAEEIIEAVQAAGTGMSEETLRSIIRGELETGVLQVDINLPTIPQQ